MSHNVLYITHRGERHQQSALAGAPADLNVTMLRDPSKQEIIQNLGGKEFLITERMETIDADIIAAGTDLRLIQRLGSQVYDIDLDAARQAGVAVCYAPIRMTVMVAEHMMTQMLALSKRLRESMYIISLDKEWGMPPTECDEDQFVVNFTSRQNIGALYKSTVGIAGFGEIGIELARRLRCFETTVLYNKRNPLSKYAEADLKIAYVDMDELLRRSDYVAMLLPYAPEVVGIVNREFIQKMKPGACIASCGASGIFNEADVGAALASGYLGGVATDTFAWEPVRRDSPLLAAAKNPEANIVLTPHTATGSVDPASEPDRTEDYANLVRLLNGQPLDYRVV
ncbi:MAG: hypothetical protein IT308_03090 [Anaerolineaceae bacterium]|nr:hypothetical protein [Anaerolineaceae bacterium]